MKPTLTASDRLFESMPPRVFVIDNDTSLRWALDSVAHGACWRTETVPSVGALMGRRCTFAPSCLVLDVSERDPDDLLPRRWPTDMPVICVTDVGDVPLSVRAMRAGAVDVLTKPVARASLLEAVRLALNLSEMSLRREVELDDMRERYASLSGREREVMALVASGLLNKQVGRELGISEVTVKAHRGNVMRKMKSPSLANLVMIAARLQLMQCDGVAPCARLPPPSHQPPHPQLDDSISRAAFRIESGSNPNLPSSAFRGADPPKVCMPITRPFCPT
jgi:FixJ family two-component response regulator